MQYEVKNAPLPVLICKLDPNESIECQKGAMSWMTPTMQMQTGLGSGAGGLLGALGKMAKSAVTGESISEIHTQLRAAQARSHSLPASPATSSALTHQ